MQNDALAWKKKYLDLLDEQDALEVNFSTQTSLLKRALFRSSLAAEGNDEQLDQQLQKLRTVLRKDASNAELEQQIDLLESAVLQYEDTLQQRKDSISKALSHLVQQLQALQPPKEVKKALKGFENNLHKQLAQSHSLHGILQQLSVLQEQAVTAATQADSSAPHAAPGLFARLFKAASPATPAESESESESKIVAEAPQQSTSETLPPTAEPAARQSIQHNKASEQEDDNYALPSLADINYSAVAEHIHNTLNALLNDLPVTDIHDQQVVALRARINQGLNWYELAPLLDELFSFILTLSTGSNNELEQYLQQLNQHLLAFHDSLQTTSSSYRDSVSEARTLDSELREQVTHLQGDVQSSTDLATLKQQVDSRLNSLIERLQAYQEQQAQSNSDILERFHNLAEHAKQMENETQVLSIKLEEQRQKALIDPLTELPNRAAWNERFDLEYARLQRNAGSLLLAIIDIDHFKRINDNYGHLAGDKVLKIIAAELKKRLRKTDFIARFGGEEYSVLLPDTPLQHGYALLDTLRQAVQDCPFHFKGTPVTITFSAGVGQISLHETQEQAFERIDQALYTAKDSGRNTVHSADPLDADAN